MEGLAQHDVSLLLHFLQSINVTCGLPEFRKRVVSALPLLISSDVSGYNEVNMRAQRNATVVYPEEGVHFQGSMEIFEQYLHQHPLISHTAKTRDSRVLKISDFLSDAQFERLGLYQDFFRVIGTKYQMGVSLSIRRSVLVGLALNRSRPDFTERERLLFSLVRPHLVQAYENCLAWTRMTEELDSAHHALDNLRAAVVNLEMDGRVVALSPAARRLLEKYFDGRPKTLGLPELLRTWLKEQSGAKLRAVRPLQVSRGDDRLTVRATSKEGRVILLLVEQAPAASAATLQIVGLTPREAEVLIWVAQGRTNLEIADLLAMSARTVQKHLEHIFRKLGVESRTAAAARAWQILKVPEN